MTRRNGLTYDTREKKEETRKKIQAIMSDETPFSENNNFKGFCISFPLKNHKHVEYNFRKRNRTDKYLWDTNTLF